MSVRVEIWELKGSYWSLPLRVVWYAQLAEVRVGCGASLTAKMRQVAGERLASVATLKGSVYWTDQQRLEQVARRFWGEDPEEVVQWAPQRTEKVPVREDFEPDEFVKAYCQSPYAISHDALVVNAIWINLCKFMLHWLLGEKKTLNLIFAELNAFCLWKNWAEVSETVHDLRVLTRYSVIDGRNMALEAIRPRLKNEQTFVDGLIAFAVDSANQCLVPQGIPQQHWKEFTGAERFYLKLLDLESKGLKTLEHFK